MTPTLNDRIREEAKRRAERVGDSPVHWSSTASISAALRTRFMDGSTFALAEVRTLILASRMSDCEMVTECGLIQHRPGYTERESLRSWLLSKLDGKAGG